ncbi:MAG: metallophosphoesterase, partial [Chitinophagaceae bacterium]|nr:metallophosphoesterase [Chitinophagaceae bacterium]
MRKLLFLLFLSAFSPLAGQQLSHRFYLIGDAGELSINQNGLKALLEQHNNTSIQSTVLFLGDNIYPKGMPKEGAKGREKTEQIMQAQLSLIEKFKSEVYFLPGNHDWQRGGKAGVDFIRNQQQWIDSLNNPLIHFQPTGGCPGPIEIPIGDKLVLIILDSQWFLHPWERPEGEESACDAKTPEDVWIKLEDVLERNRSKRIVVAAHHPIFTYGEHGGVFTLTDHLFPLLSVNKNLYIPLPVLGSIYPLYRSIFGNIQDTAHPVSKRYRQVLSTLLERFPNSIYVNGHEHALQYVVKNRVHYVTSGSGAKTTTVKQKGYSKYGSSRHGFASIDVYDDGTSAIQYFEVGNSAIAYEVRLPTLPVPVEEDSNALPDFIKPVLSQASLRYDRGRGKMLGINYRDEWKQQIEVPVFDIGREHGGLKILQKGGGMQTLSLRLADSLENEYTLRSVEKYPEKAIPEILRGTIAQDVVQDQISAAHPYGALVVQDMAKAANIFYTKPTVVFIPDDPRLGIYRKDFANTLALYEERPDGDASNKPHFGNSKKIVSTDKV